MMAIERYFNEIYRLLEQVLHTQKEAIGHAVRVVATALQEDGTLYAFGTGHSHIFTLTTTNTDLACNNGKNLFVICDVIHLKNMA